MASELPAAEDWLIYEYLRKISGRAVEFSRHKIPSQTLQNAIKTEIDMAVGGSQHLSKVSMYLDYYWAIYIHRGRGVVKPRDKVVLVWFSNPSDDPRIGESRNYPKHRYPQRLLTKQEFEDGVAKNKRMIARRKKAGITGDDLYKDLYMIISHLSKKTKHYMSGHSHPAKFWDNSKGMQGFHEIASAMLKKDLHKFVKSSLPTWKG